VLKALQNAVALIDTGVITLIGKATSSPQSHLVALSTWKTVGISCSLRSRFQ